MHPSLFFNWKVAATVPLHSSENHNMYLVEEFGPVHKFYHASHIMGFDM
jgi:hypothetical protein